MTAHLARSKWVSLELDELDSSLAVSGIPQLLVQAVSNVVVNGIEAAPENGRVRLAAQARASGGIALSVENNGPPIHPAEFDDLFQPFHTTKDNASGLGMTITDSIVRDHGGTIEFRNGGEGTIFSIVLPAKKSQDRGEGDGTEASEDATPVVERALMGIDFPIGPNGENKDRSTSVIGERFANERD
jgi:signal transduction histidine kinase